MQGTITGRDVFAQAPTILRLFGVSAFLACAWAAMARRHSTFLGVLYGSAGDDPTSRGGPAAKGWRALP
ncbi:MAG TPA: hypothetical protein VFR85_17280 [Anaeromyxobacteraceae bacterium]|nr:hypothetical protein [Anaeromyxobacteraceae bacterium]